MNNIPSDIVLMIYNNLHLLDIYNLNIVNKYFYDIFRMNKKYIIKNSTNEIIDLYNDSIIYNVRKDYYDNAFIDNAITKNNKVKFSFYHDNSYNIYKYRNYIYKITLNYKDSFLIKKTLDKLENIYFLDIAFNDINDISFLSNINIKKLNLSKCIHINNLPKFKCLEEINLSNCPRLFFNNDVLSLLKNVKIINLSYCNNLSDDLDLSILENVIDLNISSCTKLKSDITCLKKLEKLNIYNCNNIIYNFNYLNNLKSVIIDCVFYNKNKHNLNKYFNKENIKHCCLSDNKKYCFTCNKCIETTKIYYM